MISVDRSGVDLPAVLDPAGGDGAVERQSAIDEIAASEAAGRKPKLTFKIYKHLTVKWALHRLFHGKCAYCESRYAASATMDVEHFRPKKAVEKWNGNPPRPRGYYWLGGEWTNLLPSCIDCNRRREHLNLDDLEPEDLAGSGGPTLGKRAIFPVENEALRWTSHDQIDEEQPLLLNPCVEADRPESLLLFDDEGLVRPAAGLDPLERKRVEASVEIYGLNRPGLVQERVAWLRLILHRMSTIDQVVVLMDELEPESPDQAMAENLLQFLLDDLMSFQDPRRPYSLMARQLTERFLADFE